MHDLGAEHKFTSYGALYLMAPGVFASITVFLAWAANNSEPHYRRATTLALGSGAVNAVCFPFGQYLFLPLFISYFSGRYLEYLEFPNQRRTKIQENNNHESNFVSILLSGSVFFF